jgi:hypothetical protein
MGSGRCERSPPGGLIHVLLVMAVAIVFQAAAIGSELAEGGADLAGPRWPGRTRGPAGREDTIVVR